ncbi:hypothetical protein vseg_000201 [Gypsophila vaccaria]
MPRNNPQNETLISPETPQQPPQNTAKANRKFLSILLQALIMTLIVSLFFIFIGVAAIIFVHLCVVGGALHRRRRRRCVPPPTLTSAAAMPAVARSDSAEVCAICLENVEIGELIRVLMSCDHVFHVDCVDRWLVRVNACPTCRRTVAVEGRDRTAGFDWERLWLSCG